MLLSELFADADGFFISGSADTDVTDVISDSRRAHPGVLFAALKGAEYDGHSFCDKAYESGCRAFLVERRVNLPDDAAVFITPNARTALADISAKFYGYPSEKLKVIGITGTKGKTTAAVMLKQVLDACGHPAGYIGTCGITFAGQSLSTVNTTPESHIIQRYLAEMVENGVEYAVLEVSSQALKMGRVRGIRFDTCIFTNLSRDHIGGSEHADFEEYRECKHTLFTDYGAKTVIYNADDAACGYMLNGTSADRLISVSATGASKADFIAGAFLQWRTGELLGSRFICSYGRRNVECSVHFAGKFSAYNALNVLAFCDSIGISPKDAARHLENTSVPGRFELVTLQGKPGVTFIIDYAHNGVSLRSVLNSLREYEPRRLIVLFGSVGGRTYERRQELGSAAAELADYSIITADNPNNEPPENVNADIARAFEGTDAKFITFADRRDAINHAIEISHDGDIVLLAGKGHEKTQLINGVHQPFCERDLLEGYARRYAIR